MNTNSSHVACDAIDRNIDRALSGLRDAQPRTGMDGRILTSLKHRTASALPGRLHLATQLAVWAATSAAILAVASLVVLHRRPEPGQIAYTTQTHVDSQTQMAAIVGPRTGSRPASIERRLSASRRPEQRAAKRRSSVIQGAQSPHAVTTVTTDLDAQAVADLHAPSHPAPPLPLTPQEKLFLRLLRYGNATQLAELDPVVRAKQDADETAAFKAFFPDPPPLKQPGDNE